MSVLARTLSAQSKKPGKWPVQYSRVAPEWRWFYRSMIDHAVVWEGGGDPFSLNGIKGVRQFGTVPWAVSGFGPYLQDDGSEANVEFADVGELSSSGRYTLITYFRVGDTSASLSDFDHPVAYFCTPATDSFSGSVNLSGELFVFTDGGNTNTEASGTLVVDDNEWHLAHLTWDQPGGVIQIYVDGALNYEVTGYGDTSSDTNAPLGFGNHDNSAAQTTNNLQIGVQDRIWTADEVAQHARDPFGPFRMARQTMVVVPAAGGTESISATLAGVSSDSGPASLTEHPTATLAGTSLDSVDSIILNLAGDNILAGTSVDSATASLQESTSATLAGTSLDSGTISVGEIISIAATLAGTSLDSGTMSLSEAITAILAGASLDSATISTLEHLVAALEGNSLDSGSITAVLGSGGLGPIPNTFLTYDAVGIREDLRPGRGKYDTPAAERRRRRLQEDK